MLLIVLLYLLFGVATLMFDVAIDHPWVYYLVYLSSLLPLQD